MNVEITIDVAKLLVVALAVVGCLLVFISYQIHKLIEYSKPRYNSKVGQQIVELSENKRSVLGAKRALNDELQEAIEESRKHLDYADRWQRKANHIMQEIQLRYEQSQELFTSGDRK